MSLSDQPAFPRAGIPSTTTGRDGEVYPIGDEPGMTYRQWLVGMVLVGVIVRTKDAQNLDLAGRVAVELADAAIRAREK